MSEASSCPRGQHRVFLSPPAPPPPRLCPPRLIKVLLKIKHFPHPLLPLQLLLRFFSVFVFLLVCASNVVVVVFALFGIS